MGNRIDELRAASGASIWAHSLWGAAWVLLALAALSMCAGLLGVLRFGTLRYIAGECPVDRQLGIAMVQTAAEYGPRFLDPWSRQEPVFYQFAFYWIVGMTCRLTGLGWWTVINLSQPIIAPLAIFAVMRLCRVILRNSAHAIAATLLVFLYGSLEFLLTGDMAEMRVFGRHAILVPVLRMCSGPYTDTVAVLLGLLATSFLIEILDAGHEASAGQRRLFLLFGLCAVLFHLLVAVAMVVLWGALITSHLAAAKPEALRRTLPWFAVLGTAYAATLALSGWRPPMWAIAGVAAAGALVLWRTPEVRKPLMLLVMAMAPALVYVVANVLVVNHHGGTGTLYNDNIRTADLAIPALHYAVAFLPVLLAGAYAMITEPDRRTRMIFIALAATTLLTVFNHAAGYNNHPYRFIPWTTPLLCCMAMTGLLRLYDQRTAMAAKLAFVLLVSLILLGVIANVRMCIGYWPLLAHPIQEQSLNAAQLIESCRKQHPAAVFAVGSGSKGYEELAALTPARFLGRSILEPNWQSDLIPFLMAGKSDQVLDQDTLEVMKLAGADYVLVQSRTGPTLIPTDGADVGATRPQERPAAFWLRQEHHETELDRAAQ